MDLTSFYAQFRDETADNLRVLNDALLAIEGQAGETLRRSELDRAFRAVHTIKGAARMLGFDPIAQVAHAIEHVLGEIRQERCTLDRPLADLLLRGGDLIGQLVAEAPQMPAPALAAVPEIVQALGAASPAEPAAAPSSPPAAAPQPPPALAEPAPRAARQTVRVRVDRLDRLFNLAGELAVNQQWLGEVGQELYRLQEAVERQQRAVQALERELARLRFSPTQRQALDARLATLRDAQAALADLAQRQSDRLDRHLARQQMLVKDLEQEVMAVRLLPIATIFNSLPRLVRDLAAATNKQATIEIRGETTELDRKVLEVISDPLVHLVRNAVDHGLEAPDERVAAGKPPVGLIQISAESAGNEVRIQIRDDGRGIDPERVRQRAVELGMLGAERARQLDTQEALDVIFQPGFSTARTVTEISGRGVGMDIVRANLIELGGQVRVDSIVGQGTTVTLTIPLTLITSRVLLVQAGRQMLALPAATIRGILWVRRDQVQLIDGQPTIAYQQQTVALLSLAELLGMNVDAPLVRHPRAPALLLNARQRRIALLVDDLLDEREAVVKPLGPLFARRPALSGAVQLGDGGLALLINPLQLIEGGARRAAALPVLSQSLRDESRRARLLVVDDSFTTRELLRSILQSAGYEVTVAIDGADALDRLRSTTYDLVVSDIEMPRVDGFTLTTRIRRELALSELPVVLITSLASEEHRRRGLEAGAQAYIVKSQFNQDSLLKVIQQLLGHEE
ncbi:hybrid sensor histidine kinase/response regulator [uncultured Chloroflexus sp.]|uniref:hybrid sensor histidine kinase/response regulator n=1 Tax=uncultured Chloroflexus sp. TaxID=214040 RepID=UPI002625158F|nr:hybrid sensor histidine kinase/response regulator [uncultured Chloroflexus sp.]